MRVITFHKILIATAIVFFLGYALWEVRNYANTGDAGASLRSFVSVLASVGLGVYLRWFLRSLKQGGGRHP